MVTATVLFLLYRYVKGAVGIERFGVWSLVAGTTLSANVAEFGLSGAALRFVAHALGRGDRTEAEAVAETAVLSALGLLTAAALLLYAPLSLGLEYLLRDAEPALTAEARLLLPWTLAGVVLTGTAAACLGALDGTQRVHVRSALVATGSLVLLASALVLVPRLGLVGFVVAQLVQGVFLIVSAWTALRRSLPGLQMMPYRWARRRFRLLIGYGLQWQTITLLMLLAEPTSKALITRYGGLAYVGHFEFASKVALQGRNVLAAAQAALLPYLTRLHAHATERLAVFYALSLRATLAVVLLAIPFAMALTPLAAAFWGERGDAAMLLAMLLAAWGVNLLSNPAYNEFAGRGTLGPNVVSHLVLALANVGLAVLMGGLFGGIGVVGAFAGALVLSSLVTLGLYHKRFGGLPDGRALRYDLRFLLGPLGGAGLAAIAHRAAEAPLLLPWYGVLATACVLYVVAAGWLLWHHPVRRALLQHLHAPATLAAP